MNSQILTVIILIVILVGIMWLWVLPAYRYYNPAIEQVSQDEVMRRMQQEMGHSDIDHGGASAATLPDDAY